MNPTQAQIRNLNTQVSEQMRRYVRRCLMRISNKNRPKTKTERNQNEKL